jgi:tetratricopeptide (TPR) repeat protein
MRAIDTLKVASILPEKIFGIDGQTFLLAIVLPVVLFAVTIVVAIVIYRLQKKSSKKNQEANQRQIQGLQSDIGALSKKLDLVIPYFLQIRAIDILTLLRDGLDALYKQREFSKAIEIFKKGLELTSNDEERITFLILITTSQLLSDEAEIIRESERTLLVAINIAEKADLKEALTAAYNTLGLVCLRLDNLQRSSYFLTKAFQAAQEINDKGSQASILGNLGIVYQALGNHKEAKRAFEQALFIVEQIENKEDLSSCLLNLSNIHLSTGGFQKAFELLQRALAIDEERSDEEGQRH